MEGIVEAICISDRQETLPTAVERVRAVAGQGLDGEYHDDVTLIAAETFDDPDVPIGHAESRRNVLTRGIDLNALVGRRFAVGGVECEGVELAEPCRQLERLNGERPLLRHLAHRAGLRAAIVSDGVIAVGNAVRAL